MPNYVAGDLRDQLAHAGYSMVSAGLVVGSGGNLSARVPDADTCWVTGAGTWLDRLDRPDFAKVRLADGATVGGTVAPSSELPLHLHQDVVLLKADLPPAPSDSPARVDLHLTSSMRRDDLVNLSAEAAP